MSENVFDGTTDEFIGPQPFAFDRASMVAGDPGTFVTFRDPAFFNGSSDAFPPADLDGLNSPPAGAPEPFHIAGVYTSSRPLLRLLDDKVNPSSTDFIHCCT